MLDTKERLISAARRIFADRGFRTATVRQIAALAGTNLASINYHFKSKEALYLAVLRQSFVQPETDAAEVEGAAGPEDRLLAFIERTIGRADYPESADRTRLIAWETLAPTGLLEARELIALQPLLIEALAVVKDFCRDKSGDDPVVAARWLLGQCVIFRTIQTQDDVERRALAARIFHLALGGLQTCAETRTDKALPAYCADAE